MSSIVILKDIFFHKPYLIWSLLKHWVIETTSERVKKQRDSPNSRFFPDIHLSSVEYTVKHAHKLSDGQVIPSGLPFIFQCAESFIVTLYLRLPL